MHPLPYIPRTIRSSDQEEIEIIQLSGKGKRSLTEDGGQPILMGLSQKRGA